VACGRILGHRCYLSGSCGINKTQAAVFLIGDEQGAF
jgi:hypothetical protein